MALAPSTGVGARPHRATFQNPGPAVSDGDGSYTQTWSDTSPPSLSVRIRAATASDLERVAAGTVLSTATHIVNAPYHPQITTKSRMLFSGRTFSVVGISNPDERNVELILTVVEVVQ
jgi:SPP1 family predicted phage head-tail adaptor